MLEKKFLDYDGVQHLWTKLSMEDYPNNETLVAVINAIDATKADKDKLSAVATSGSYTDLLNQPQSLPANGGNADTVNNYKIVVSNQIPTVDDKTIITLVI